VLVGSDLRVWAKLTEWISLQSSDHRWWAVDSARVDQAAPVLTERRWGKVRFPLGGGVLLVKTREARKRIGRIRLEGPNVA
jgi:hypothetical protein